MTIPIPNPSPLRNIACFSDFDGTVTDEDSNDFMIDNLGMGRPARRELLLKVLHEGLPFREAFHDMIDSVAAKYSFEKCCELVKEANIKLDPGFKGFYEFTKARDIPLILVSRYLLI
jgi:2-hydroxy-3-keto-5-methylthiopentenyl-1-phosphate phosphatase